MTKAFNYNFRKVGGDIDIQAIGGYLQALNELYKHIARETEFNPAKRLIDSVPILEKISQTNAELMQLIKEAQKELIGSIELTSSEADLINQSKLS